MTQTDPPRRYAVVLNPSAGRGLAEREWPRLEAELRRHRLPFDLIREPSGAAALERVCALPADVAVLAVGGDGTVTALLPAVVDETGLGRGRALGLVPLGSGNDFAGMLGLRPGDFAGALDRLAAPPCRVDALRVRIVEGDVAGTSRLLLNGLGMGLDAEVAALLPQAPARLSGFGRYTWAALTALRGLTLTPVTVEVDGAVVYSGPSCLAAVMNGTRYGAGFRVSPLSDPGDGRLNAVVSGPVGRLQVLGLMGLLLRGRHLGHPQVHHAAGRRVTATWARPTHLHLDGDLAGRVTRVEVEMLPGAVTLLGGAVSRQRSAKDRRPQPEPGRCVLKADG
ncbi:diacylglycerol kinase [Deinococcus aetherius]|uniref:Diacylglycerol kinase n=1 Tax=Deinococcus aetherius TaxID=200252 RepID=A0ABM8ADU2_9DEIO|nr:diacylglycerol kinase family protein [Deinococcus aetherius]BDP41964.1 diacylglycerol kinase [Deinococcus aetherius]